MSITFDLAAEIAAMVKKVNDEERTRLEAYNRYVEEQERALNEEVDKVVTKIPKIVYNALKEKPYTPLITLYHVPKSDYSDPIAHKHEAKLVGRSFSNRLWCRLVDAGISPKIYYTETSNHEDAYNHYLECSCYIAIDNPNLKEAANP
jgi:hypothetical protein